MCIKHALKAGIQMKISVNKSVLSNIKEAKKSPTIGYWYMSQNGASVHGGASLVLPNKSVSDGVIKLRSDEEVLEMFDR